MWVNHGSIVRLIEIDQERLAGEFGWRRRCDFAPALATKQMQLPRGDVHDHGITRSAPAPSAPP